MFNSKKIKQLEEENKRLLDNCESYSKKLIDCENIITAAKKYASIEDLISQRENQYKRLSDDVGQLKETQEVLKKQINTFSDEISFNSINLYTPHYSYKDTNEYKAALSENIRLQKELIRQHNAVKIPAKGSVGLNGNNSQGYKIVKYFAEMMLSNFNSSCDNIIDKATIFNYSQLLERIKAVFDKINSKGEILGIYITKEFYNLKVEQLLIENDRIFTKEKEKQEKERQKELLKEQEAVLKEIEDAKAKLEKERAHYEQQFEKNPTEEIQNKIKDIDSKIADNDWRNAHQSAGYVYIISCDDMKPMLKIGTTRRLDPYQRIAELSNASHAFKFKCHAIIFSEDAFSLEAALHQEFAQYKVNKVNQHKEFFEISIDKVADVLYSKYNIKDKIDLNPICEDYELSKGM